jgi:hypothetical protein
LGNRQVIEFINNNLIFWACSRNLPEGKKVYNALKAKRSPFLGMIVLRNNKMTLVTRMEGPISKCIKFELISGLIVYICSPDRISCAVKFNDSRL